MWYAPQKIQRWVWWKLAGTLDLKQYFSPGLLQAVFFHVDGPAKIVCVWGSGRNGGGVFVCLVLAFADGKTHEYSHDANVFLQVNYITWPGIFHQCPPFPQPVKLLHSYKNLAGNQQVYLWVKIWKTRLNKDRLNVEWGNAVLERVVDVKYAKKKYLITFCYKCSCFMLVFFKIWNSMVFF